MSGYLRYHVPPSGLRVHPLRRHAASYQHTKLGRSWTINKMCRPKISKDHVLRLYGKNHENTTEHRWNKHSNTNIWNKQSWRHIIHKSRVCVGTTVIIPQNIVGLHKKTWNLSSMIWLDSFKFHFFGALLQPLYLLVLQMSIILAGVAALEIKPGHTLSIRCSQSCCATKPRQTTDSFNKQSASTYMQIPGMTGWMFAVNDWQIFIILIIHTDKTCTKGKTAQTLSDVCIFTINLSS